MLRLFERFFPMATYLRHLADVDARWQRETHGTSRHDFSKHQFARWLGTLVHMCLHPKPSTEWHWRLPGSFPEGAIGSPLLRGVFSEWTWKRFWADLTIPGLDPSNQLD